MIFKLNNDDLFIEKERKKKVKGVYLRARALNPNRKPADLWAARVLEINSKRVVILSCLTNNTRIFLKSIFEISV